MDRSFAKMELLSHLQLSISAKLSGNGFSDAFLAILGGEIGAIFSFVTLVEGSATMGGKK